MSTKHIGENYSQKRMTPTVITDRTFTECRFNGTQFDSGSVISKTVFVNCTFIRAQFYSVTFNDCHFIKCDFTGASMGKCLGLRTCSFTKSCDLRSVLGARAVVVMLGGVEEYKLVPDITESRRISQVIASADDVIRGPKIESRERPYWKDQRSNLDIYNREIKVAETFEDVEPILEAAELNCYRSPRVDPVNDTSDIDEWDEYVGFMCGPAHPSYAASQTGKHGYGSTAVLFCSNINLYRDDQ